jgi:hypothetical protein
VGYKTISVSLSKATLLTGLRDISVPGTDDLAVGSDNRPLLFSPALDMIPSMWLTVYTLPWGSAHYVPVEIPPG